MNDLPESASNTNQEERLTTAKRDKYAELKKKEFKRHHLKFAYRFPDNTERAETLQALARPPILEEAKNALKTFRNNKTLDVDRIAALKPCSV